VRAGALPERLLEVMELLVGQAGGVPGGAGAAQCVLPAGAPAGVPAADVLRGDAKLVSDLRLGAAGGKQCAGLQTDALERLAVMKTTGVAAVGGWFPCRYAAKTTTISRSNHLTAPVCPVARPPWVKIGLVAR
jgi:hypothetical protein